MKFLDGFGEQAYALLRIVAGLLKVGTLMKYLPQPLVTGFTAGIAAKARGAVQRNPMSRVRTETLARQIAAERGVSYGLSVIDGWYYVGTPKELAAVGALKRNPLTRGETADIVRLARRDYATARRLPKNSKVKAYYIGSGDGLKYAAMRHGQLKRVGKRPILANPRIVGRAGKEPVFKGTRTQAAAYARKHGLGVPYQVGIRKGARV